VVLFFIFWVSYRWKTPNPLYFSPPFFCEKQWLKKLSHVVSQSNLDCWSPIVVFIEGRVTTDFEDGDGVLIISYAPTTNDTFKPVSGNVTVNVPDGGSPKQIKTLVNISEAGAKIGDQGVLQAFYTDGMNTTWYQCADINVVAAYSGASSIIGTSEVAFFTTILVSFIMSIL